MKLVLFNDYRPGLLKGDSVVDLGAIVSPFGAQTGQAAIEAIISHIDDLRGQLSSLEQEGEGVPLSTVALRPLSPVLTRYYAWEGTSGSSEPDSRLRCGDSLNPLSP